MTPQSLDRQAIGPHGAFWRALASITARDCDAFLLGAAVMFLIAMAPQLVAMVRIWRSF